MGKEAKLELSVVGNNQRISRLGSEGFSNLVLVLLESRLILKYNHK